MATTSPASAPPPASPPPITTPSVPSPSNSTAIPPATPSAPPPATPSAPPPAIPTTAPPPATPPTATPSIPSPPVTPSTPPATPPATPSSPPPPATVLTPPPATPSSPPPPATVLTPPPATPSSPPPPATVLTPPPATPSSRPPPATVLTPPPATPSSPPPPATVLTPPPATPSPPTSEAPPPETPPALAPPTPSVSPSELPNSSPSSAPSLSPPVSVTPTPPAPASEGSGGTTPGSTNPPPSAISPPPPNSTSNSSGSGVSTSVVVGVVVGGGVLLLLLALFFILRKRKIRRNEAHHHDGHPTMVLPPSGQSWQQESHVPPAAENNVTDMPPNLSSSAASGSIYSLPVTPYKAASGGIGFGFSKSAFTYEEIVRATDGFSDGNLLGQGGFGYVHRGILSDGKEVAVKQLKTGSGQGEREFQAEVEIISRVHHRHLVSLVGYCTTGDKRILIYEFVPNYTMEFHLHGEGRPTMEWSTRMKIALGSAKGLAYLHEDCHPKIIHRDIKAANILIDFQFEAMVADFGLAKFTADDNTHVSTRVMGTFGYLAPEYASSGKLSDKSDVFSFGVMLLELITGRRPIDTTNTFNDDSLVDWARPLLTRAIEEKKYDGLVDPRLRNNYDINEMAQMVASAAACIRHSARRRPRMSKIVRALEGDVNLDDLHEGTKPGHSTVHSSVGGSDYDTTMYKEDMKKFRKLALTSEEYGSSDQYSQGTSEYGLNPSGSSSEAQTREMENKRKMNKDSGGFV